MKKVIALFLALSVLLSAVPGFEVSAATDNAGLGFRIEPSKYLAYRGSQFPRLVTGARSEGDILLSWQEQGADSGTELYYVFEEKGAPSPVQPRAGRFIVRMTDSDEMYVEFQLEDPAGTARTTSGFSIYSSLLADGGPRFQPFVTFMNKVGGERVHNVNVDGKTVVPDYMSYPNSDPDLDYVTASNLPHSPLYGGNYADFASSNYNLADRLVAMTSTGKDSNNMGPAADTGNYHPLFRVTRGGGFTFQYNGITVSFLWGEDGRVYFQTDKLANNIIYDFTLSSFGDISANMPQFSASSGATAANPVTSRDHIYFFSGYDTASIESTPTSNAASSASSGTPAPNTGPGQMFEYVPPYPPTTPEPGNDIVDITMTFDLPRVWAGGAFTVPTAPTGYDRVPLEMTVNGDNGFRLNIRDLFSLTGTAVDTAANPNEILIVSSGFSGAKKPWLKASAERAGTQVKVRLYDIDAGSPTYSRIYDGFMGMKESAPFDGETTPEFYPDPVGIPAGKVFTLLHYWYKPGDGVRYLEFHTYKNLSDGSAVRGKYQLFSGAYNYDPDTKTWEAERDFSDPRYPAPPDVYEFNITGTRKQYYIRFITDSGEMIFSQYFLVDPPPMPPVDTLVTDFSAEVKSLTPTKKDPDIPYDEESELVIRLRWDVGSLSEFISYFDTHTVSPANEVTAVYEFKRALTQDSTEAQMRKFARLELVFTSADVFTITDFTDPGDPDFDDEMKGKYIPGSGQIYTQGDRIYAEADVRVPAYRLSESNDKVDNEEFVYPGVYFLNTVLRYRQYQDNSEAPKITAPKNSPYDNLTLSEISPDTVIPPQNLTAYDPGLNSTGGGFKLSWDLPDAGLQKYLQGHFKNTPVEHRNNISHDDCIEAQAQMYMNVYISADRLNLQREYGDDKGLKKNALYEERITVIPARDGNARVDFGSVSGRQYAFDSAHPDYAAVIAALRADKIAAFTGWEVSADVLQSLYEQGGGDQKYIMTFDGLDTNEVYYIYADLAINDIGNPDPNAYEKDEVSPSPMSNLESVTLPDDIKVPSGKEKEPPAPDLRAPREFVETDRATLIWHEVTDGSENDDGTPALIEYEMIRLKDAQMPDGYLNMKGIEVIGKNDLKTVWGDLGVTPENKHGIIINSGNGDNPPNIQNWDGTSRTNADPDEFTFRRYDDPEDLRDFLSVTNMKLFPNQMYFYYVRTVKTVVTDTGVITLYSEWSRASVTTDVVDPPVNLKINNTVTIDEKTEVVIEFDAIADPALLGAVYRFEYQLRRDAGNWEDPPVQMGNETLKRSVSVNNDPELKDKGYNWHYTYKITGLSPGSMYQIRVRLADVTSGDASMYSNIAEFRTGFDNEGYEKERETDDWLKRLKELLDELLTNPYWISKKSVSEWEVIYRPERFQGVLAGTSDSAILLPVSEAGKTAYYIPMQSLIAANAANKGFKARHGSTEVLISPGAVSEAYNDAVLKMGDEIKLKNAADSYLRVRIDYSVFNGGIEGSSAFSERIDITAEIVGSAKAAAVLDEELMNEFVLKIDSLIKDRRIREQIGQNVQMELLDTDFVKYIEQIVDSALTGFIQTANTRLNSGLKTAISVAAFDKPIIITAADLETTASVSGYSLEHNAWNPIEALPFGGRRGIYVSKPGSYVLAWRAIVIPGIEEMKNGGNIGGIAGKYALDDFIGSDGVINMNLPADRFTVISSAARIAGAPKGSDAAKWLRDSMNVTVSARNMYQSITTEEAVYIVMAVYAAKTKTNIAAIRIKNMAAAQNIAGISDSYRQHIRAAFDIGIYTNSAMKPKGDITVRDFFEMLGRLDAKLKL